MTHIKTQNLISDYQQNGLALPLKLHGNLKGIFSGQYFHSSLSDPVGAKGGTGQFSASEIQKFNLRVTFKKEITKKSKDQRNHKNQRTEK